VPARVFANAGLWRQIVHDRSLEQLMNVATLPGMHRCVYGMPDMHEGYGFPVGVVVAMRATDAVGMATEGTAMKACYPSPYARCLKSG
jgi:tRNA-splicing ligase RtcB